MQRRSLLKYLSFGLLLKPFKVLADWNNAAFWSAHQTDSLAKLFPGKSINTSDQITIGARSFIENGAVVPIKINTSLPKVTSISIYVEKNPNPLIAHFELSPRSLGFVATRIKIDKPSNISALVQSDGELYQTTMFIEVAKGGC